MGGGGESVHVLNPQQGEYTGTSEPVWPSGKALGW